MVSVITSIASNVTNFQAAQPVVYCVESPDLLGNVRVQELVVPSNVNLTTRYDSELLSGVFVIEGRFLFRPHSDWSGKLYCKRNETAESYIDVRMIAYYAWANRGESEMSVWLPVK